MPRAGDWSEGDFALKRVRSFHSAPRDKGLTTTGSNNVNRPGNRSRVLIEQLPARFARAEGPLSLLGQNLLTSPREEERRAATH